MPASPPNPTQVDENKLNAFIEEMRSDLGGAPSTAMARSGDALGLDKALTSTVPCRQERRADHPLAPVPAFRLAPLLRTCRRCP